MDKRSVLAFAAAATMLGLGALAGCSKSNDLTPMDAPPVAPTNAAAAVPMRNGVAIKPLGGGAPSAMPSGMHSTPNPLGR